jgi:purine-nucleoside phosphorylase
MTAEPGVVTPGSGDRIVEEGVALIRERCGLRPAVAVVLGSGLGDAVAEDVVPAADYVYGSLPGFPQASVPGHAGRLVLGELYGVPAAVFRGRVHYYEGHGVAATTLITRLAAGLGAPTLVLTNAAGGLDPAMRAGQLMLLRDHINVMGVNPLFGWRFPGGGPAFVSLQHVYDPGLLSLAEEGAAAAGVSVLRGVYAAVSGPSYETTAEREALRRLGADAVGMSTVPEAVAAAALGLRVLGISCITNVAGDQDAHTDVLAVAKRSAAELRAVLSHVVPGLVQAGPEVRDQEGAG